MTRRSERHTRMQKSVPNLRRVKMSKMGHGDLSSCWLFCDLKSSSGVVPWYVYWYSPFACYYKRNLQTHKPLEKIKVNPEKSIRIPGQVEGAWPLRWYVQPAVNHQPSYRWGDSDSWPRAGNPRCQKIRKVVPSEARN